MEIQAVVAPQPFSGVGSRNFLTKSIMYHQLTFEAAANMTVSEISERIHQEMYSAMGENDDREAWGRMIDQEVRDFLRRLEDYENEKEGMQS